MNESRRQKKVARLIKEILGPLFIESIQDSHSGLITITRVEMSKDLKNAFVYVSATSPKTETVDILNEKKGYLRKAIASKTKLKYNPKLIFSLDPILAQEERIDELLNNLKINGYRSRRSNQEQDPRE
jgi:ribosome-binding factor A